MKSTIRIFAFCAVASLFSACKNDLNDPINYNIVEDVQSYFTMSKREMRRALRRNYGAVTEHSNQMRGRSRTQTLVINFDADDEPYQIRYERKKALRSLDETAAVARQLAGDIHAYYSETEPAEFHHAEIDFDKAEMIYFVDYQSFSDSLEVFAGTFDEAEAQYDSKEDTDHGWSVDFEDVSDNKFEFVLTKVQTVRNAKMKNN